MNKKLIIKQLKDEGWIVLRVKGSHHQFTHPIRGGLVTVERPKNLRPDWKQAALEGENYEIRVGAT